MIFHGEDGLFFRRNDDHSVTIIKTTDGKEPECDTSSNVFFSQTIRGGVWCSLVLTMSAFNERPHDWQIYMQHHKGEKDLLAYGDEQ